jgi:hypothetical protein
MFPEVLDQYPAILRQRVPTSSRPVEAPVTPPKRSEDIPGLDNTAWLSLMQRAPESAPTPEGEAGFVWALSWAPVEDEMLSMYFGLDLEALPKLREKGEEAEDPALVTPMPTTMFLQICESTLRGEMEGHPGHPDRIVVLGGRQEHIFAASRDARRKLSPAGGQEGVLRRFEALMRKFFPKTLTANPGILALGAVGDLSIAFALVASALAEHMIPGEPLEASRYGEYVPIGPIR